MQPAVYILANRKNGTLYVGVTGNLVARVFQHRNGKLKGLPRNMGFIGWSGQRDTIGWIPPLSGKSISRSGTGPGRFN